MDTPQPPNEGEELNHLVPSENEPELRSEFLDKLISLQVREIELKSEENTLRAKDMEFSYKLSEQSIQANKEDRKESRETLLKLAKYVGLFLGAIVLLFIAFVVFAVLWNRDELVKKMYEQLIGLFTYLVTAFGGYLIRIGQEYRKKVKAENS